MRCILLLCALVGCSIDHTGLGPSSTTPSDAAADHATPDVLDAGPFSMVDAQTRDTSSPRDAHTPDTNIPDVGTDVREVDGGPADVGVDAPAIDVGPSCTDGRLNGDETDIDCGGPCSVCGLGETCRVGSDCGSRHCDDDDGRCRFPESCLDLLDGDGTLTTGAYEIDPDGSGGGASFSVWCDMDFSSGGWTLVVSSDSAGPNASVEGSPMPGTTRHLSRANLGPLALGASQVHIRTSGQADARSVTSMADTTPIENLRVFDMMETGGGGPSDSWSGPMMDNIDYRCRPARDEYPAVFHACGNSGGLHWFRGSARWVNTDANEALELYVR